MFIDTLRHYSSYGPGNLHETRVASTSQRQLSLPAGALVAPVPCQSFSQGYI